MLPSAAILTFWILKSIAESTLYSKIEGQQKSKALNTLDAVVSITFNETTLRAGRGEGKKIASNFSKEYSQQANFYPTRSGPSAGITLGLAPLR